MSYCTFVIWILYRILCIDANFQFQCVLYIIKKKKLFLCNISYLLEFLFLDCITFYYLSVTQWRPDYYLYPDALRIFAILLLYLEGTRKFMFVTYNLLCTLQINQHLKNSNVLLFYTLVTFSFKWKYKSAQRNSICSNFKNTNLKHNLHKI